MSKFAVYSALTGATVASDDLILLKDTSATATKKLPYSDVLQAALLVSTTTAIVASSVLSIGANLATNPVLAVDFATGSVATGVKITGAAAASGVALLVTSSGTNESLTINAKGSGTIGLQTTGTGNVTSAVPIVVTSASANALAVGRQGTTNPGFLIDASTATNVTGLKITPAAVAAGVDLSTISSGTNENLTVNAKGSGTISLNPTGTGNVILGVTTLQFPSAGILADTNGNELVKFAATVASAVNELTITNSATGNPLLLAATGGDTNIGVRLDAKGSGTVALNTTGTGNVTSAVPVVVTSASANALAVGRLGSTTPGLVVDASAATSITGVKITTQAAGAGVGLAAVGETNVALSIDSAGSGTIALQTTGTGNVTSTVPIVVTSASANALAVGRLGSTTPALLVDASTATSITGFSVKSAAAGAGLALAAIGETNVATTLDAKGSGTLSLNTVATGNVILGRTLQFPSTGILADAGGNELIKFPATVASAVNEVTVTNAATAAAPSIAATGGDTNISLTLTAKGTGVVQCTVPLIHKVTQTAKVGDATLTIAEVLTGCIDSTPIATSTYTLPTAANLVAGIANCKVGDSFSFLVNNKGVGGFAAVIAAGSGGTADGSLSTAQDVIRRFTIIVTNVTGAAEAYFCYGEGA